MSGLNYTLRNMGDGFAMFANTKLVKDYVGEDYFAPRLVALKTTKGITNKIEGNLDLSYCNKLEQLIEPTSLGGKLIKKKYPHDP